jgi:hypothetical protein
MLGRICMHKVNGSCDSKYIENIFMNVPAAFRTKETSCPSAKKTMYEYLRGSISSVTECGTKNYDQKVAGTNVHMCK